MFPIVDVTPTIKNASLESLLALVRSIRIVVAASVTLIFFFRFFHENPYRTVYLFAIFFFCILPLVSPVTSIVADLFNRSTHRRDLRSMYDQ
ncbi:hypothetical protein HanRHA438_Chr05g0206721 [Helianthus annuus]|nr:hypothetical protein HanRHA438_Chr05g0206721 [Helianthus annuus]